MPHIHEKIDYTVEVFVVHNHRVLLRVHDKYKIWLGVGGHVELNEDPNQAVLREVKEEVGLTVRLIGLHHKVEDDGSRELIPPAFMNRHRISESHEHVSMTYFAVSDTDQVIESETEKSDQLRWFTKDELERNQYPLKDHIKKYALAALVAAT